VALALYRKYRPATFAEVVGQEHVTEPLRKALAAGRINHAYLFSGPRGCGKTSSARILARSLNCENGPTADPCGVCASCVALAPEGPGSLDVVELDAASHGGVNDTRELRDRAFYMPAESRYRVFIIDEAHMVTKEGFNALLKIVEEPPEHLVFVFATTEPEKVLPTIRSRTHHYPFHLLPPATLRGLLEKLCGEEGVAVESAVYPLVVKAGAGSVRDALSVMDQLLAGAGPDGVTYASAVALLGVTDAALLDEMVDALAASDGASVFGAVERVAGAGHDPRRFGADLLQRLRDLVILQAVPDAAVKGLIDEPEDELVAMAAQAERLPTATLTRFAEILHTGLAEMRGTTSPRLVLELLCARMLLPAASLDDAGLLQRLERVERRLEIAAEHDAAGGGPVGGVVRADDVARGSAPVVGRGSAGRTGASAGGSTVDGRGAASDLSAEYDDARGSAATRGARTVAEQVESAQGGVEASARGGAADVAGAAPGTARSTPPSTAGPDLGLPEPPVLSGDRPRAEPSTRERRSAVSGVEGSVGPGGDTAEGSAGGAVSDLASADAAASDEGPGMAGAGPGGTVAAGATVDAAAGAQAGSAREAQPGLAEYTAPPPVSGGEIGVTDVRRVWSEVLAAVKQHRRTTQVLLESATVAALDRGVLVVSMPTAALARRVNEPGNADVLRAALRDVLGVDWRVRCESGDAAEGGSAGRPAPAASGQPSDSRTSAPAPGRDMDSGAGAGAGPAADRRGRGGTGPDTDRAPDTVRARSTARPSPTRVAARQVSEEPEEPNPYDDLDPDEDVPPDASSYQPIDPSRAAIDLLTAKLGAHPIDEGR
jgi:DNA polymerase-3 subunit gamma/tau